MGDGTTDQAAALNAMISDVPDGHDVLLPAGEYVVGSRLRLRSGINLIGSGAGSTTLRLLDEAEPTFVLLSGEAGIRISGIAFDGGQNDLAVSLQVDGCTDIVIEDCTFTRMGHAVHLYSSTTASCSGITVRNNRFSLIEDFAVRVTEGVSSVLIENNTVADVSKGEAPSPAAFYIRGVDVTVVGNTVESSADTGVLVAGPETRNVTVVGNRMRTTLVTVFLGSGASHGTIVGNTLFSERDFGVHLFDREGGSISTIVSQNHLLSSGKSGVQVEGVSDFIISSNLISDPGTRTGQKVQWRCGVTLTSTDGGGAASFVVSGNIILSEDSSSQMNYGILVTGAAEGAHIVSNVVRGALAEGVRLEQDLRAPYYVETDDAIITSRTVSTRR
ncbi:right-handed parallel beta-helix repeat-containing protein [Herbiconiux sp. VKM Ac-2851]|nr:right-handed parallel beta-helix repeat-containing protein [Herbiconiux sp. VKM Ac-2851]